MSEVTVVIGAGSIGQAIARRTSAGKKVLLADLHQGNAEVAAEVLSSAGFEVSTATVDVSQRESVHQLAETAAALGDVTGVIHAAGVSPSQASPATILAVDLYGTALVLEEFGNIIAPGGAAVVIASQSGHRLAALSAAEDAALATTLADELLSLPMLQPDHVTDSLHAYQLAKRGDSLRVMAEAVRWGKKGARVNTISPGIIITPLAKDELTGPRGEGYRRVIELCPAGRANVNSRSRELEVRYPPRPIEPKHRDQRTVHRVARKVIRYAGSSERQPSEPRSGRARSAELNHQSLRPSPGQRVAAWRAARGWP